VTSRFLVAIVTVAAGTALAACSTTVPGAPTTGADALVGRNVADVLPTADELTELTGVEIEPSAFPPSVGDEHVMPDGIRDEEDASEIQCLGATTPGMLKTYEQFPVWAVASRDLDSSYGSDTPSVDVGVTVVALTTDAAAVDALTTFTEQWQACRGKTMIVHDTAGSGYEFTHRVESVATRGEMLTASVAFTGSGNAPTTTIHQRALGVRANCLVDVEVSYFDPYHDTTAPPDLAERVAQTALDKIAAI
jgi:hypothetical protein